ncbi:MAG: hypothetical protein RIB58_11595 [Phycisphaerales bacterium]
MEYFKIVREKFGRDVYECIAVESIGVKSEYGKEMVFLGYDVAQYDANSLCQDWLLPSRGEREPVATTCQTELIRQSTNAFVQEFRARLNRCGLFGSASDAIRCLKAAGLIWDDVEEHSVQAIWSVAG